VRSLAALFLKALRTCPTRAARCVFEEAGALGEARALTRTTRAVLSRAQRAPGSHARRNPGSHALGEARALMRSARPGLFCAPARPGLSGGMRAGRRWRRPNCCRSSFACSAARTRRCAGCSSATSSPVRGRSPRRTCPHAWLSSLAAGGCRACVTFSRDAHAPCARERCLQHDAHHATGLSLCCRAVQWARGTGAAVGAVELRVSCNALLTPSSLPRRHVKGAIARRALSAALSCARGCGARPPQAEASWRGRAQT